MLNIQVDDDDSHDGGEPSDAPTLSSVGGRPKRPKLTKDEKAARSAAWAQKRAAAAMRRQTRAARDRQGQALRDAAARRLATLPEPSASLREQRAKLSEINLGKIAASAKRKRDIIDVRQPTTPTKQKVTIPPTPETMRRADYVEEPIYDRSGGRVSLVGKAFKRKPRIETIEGLTTDQRRALRYYRSVFDRSEQSEMKSQLDIRPRGGGGAEAAIGRLQEIAFANGEIARIEAMISRPAWLPILRAVALHDVDFKQLAIERYGSREVQRIDVSARKPKVASTIEPRSGRHREIIRQEFLWAAIDLTAAVLPRITAAREIVQRIAAMPTETDEQLAEAEKHQAQARIMVDPAIVDSEFLDDAGYMRPWDEIRLIILSRLEPEQ